MKVRILTAHGFLSFQPPNPLDPQHTMPPVQYRPTAGPWEEFDIVGLELPESGEPPPPPDEVPDSVEPVEQTAAFISRVKAWLESMGENLSGPCGAFTIVEHAAWWLHFTNPGVGLLSKPDGNNCRAYATDVLIAKGRIVDILGDAGGMNTPLWNPEDVFAPMDRWCPPYDPTMFAMTETAEQMDRATTTRKPR